MNKTTLVISAGLLFLAPVASAERKVTTGEAKQETLSLESVIQKHIKALGGEKLLRSGKTFTFTVSGEKLGKKFTKTVTHARPNLFRADFNHGSESGSKGFDGKVAWVQKGTAAPEQMNAEETKMMAAHAEFDEPLLDYAKKGMKVKLVGKIDAGYDLEVTTRTGEVEHHILDANTFLLAQKTWMGKTKDGKAEKMTVRFGDYKDVQGRQINHSVEWLAEDGKWNKSTVSAISFDKPVDAKFFAMPKKLSATK
jgi:hypothetical protein